jgi:sulfonate transport system substrate-binding protein
MKRFRALAMGFGLGFAIGAARAEDPVKIHIAWTAIPGQIVSVLYQKPDILRHYGKSYVVDPVYYKGSGPQITGLATGELEIATYAPAALGLSIENGHMEDLRVIGDQTRDGYADFHTRQYMVRADDNIRAIADLKGRVIGTNSISGALDMAFRAMMRQHHFEDKRDFQVVEIDFPHMFDFLVSKKIDLASITTPFNFEAEKSGKVRTLFTMKDAVGESDMTVMTARAPFIAAHRAALVDFFEDSQRALAWFYEPAHRQEVLEIIARASKKPAAEYSDWLFTKKDDYRDPDFRPNLQAVQKDLDLQAEVGLLKNRIDVHKYADLSLLEEAAKRPR